MQNTLIWWVRANMLQSLPFTLLAVARAEHLPPPLTRLSNNPFIYIYINNESIFKLLQYPLTFPLNT